MRFEKSSDTKIIEKILESAEVGQLITYQQISNAIGRDVRKHSVNSLNTARRGLLKSKGILFGVKQNSGLIRLDDKQIVQTTEGDRARVNRVAKRSLEKLSVVNFDNLDDKSKKEHIAASTQFGVLAMFSQSSSTKRIESNVENKELSIGETLKLFGG